MITAFFIVNTITITITKKDSNHARPRSRVTVIVTVILMIKQYTSEGTFRSARSIYSLSSAGVNFTVSQFLNRINKLAVLQSIKSNVNDNKLHVPHHHKLSTTLQNTSNSLNMNNLSKSSVENSVLHAYSYVTDVFTPLKIKQFSNNGRPIPRQKVSDAILRHFQAL